MENEPLRIAPRGDGKHWTDADWKKIDFNSEDGRQRAIDIFEARIRGRFLDVIRVIEQDEKVNRYAGFAIMALDCLLIETLQQFHEGVEETPRDERGRLLPYVADFLTQEFSEFFDRRMANIFYDHFRNGLLHQAETKGSSMIRTRKGSPLVARTDDGGGLVINRHKFHEELVSRFENYVRRLRSSDPNDELFRNMKKKMDAICRVGKEV